MKMLVIAVAAFGFAAPAFAQPVQAQPHQGHQMPAQPPMDHGSMPGHAGHDCCADADGNGRMDCCEHMGSQGQRPAPTPAQR